MNTYIITYNMKWKTDGRKVRTRTTYGLTKSVVAPSADVARADFLAYRTRPWVISKDITKIEEAFELTNGEDKLPTDQQRNITK